eukprot:1794418-Pleurochrysis_carterae.AAC.1
MFNVFTSPKTTASVLNDLIFPFGELTIGGADFNSATVWNLARMASSVPGAAQTFQNIRPLASNNTFLSLRKVQIQFDGMSWTRGHGCTRLIVQSPDLIQQLNSSVFSRDVVFYLGSDKTKDLKANFL